MIALSFRLTNGFTTMAMAAVPTGVPSFKGLGLHMEEVKNVCFYFY
jgi:hypothetical protein